MLYDKRWEKPEIKADPFSLDSLIAWLEKQPADERYNYCDPYGCLIAQYLQSHRLPHVLDVGELTRLGWKHIVQDTSGKPREDKDWTFGAALKRARALVR